MCYDEEPQIPEMDEFSYKIHEMIEAEVKNRIAETVESLEHYKKIVKDNAKEKAELITKVRCFDMDLKKALAEKAKEVRRELLGGFDIGDRCYLVRSKTTWNKCVECNGEGSVMGVYQGKEIKLRCPECDGNKQKAVVEYSVMEDKVRSVHLEQNTHRKWLHVYPERYDNKIEVERLYKTREEAQAVCDEKNGVKPDAS